MGIRKFLEGVDPEKCGIGFTFMEDRNGKIVGPHCPVAHGAYLRDRDRMEMFPNWGSVLAIADRFGLGHKQLMSFATLFDRAHGINDKKLRLEHAIKETENLYENT